MNPWLKFALIGGAVYLLLKDQIAEAFESPAPHGQPAPQLPPATPQPTTPAPPTPPQVTLPPQAPSAPNPTVDDRVLARAATNAHWAADAGATLLNIDQWNWYRNAYRRNILNLPEMDFEAPESYLPAGTPRDVRITAAQYHQLRTAAGLSGLASRAWRA